MARTRRAAKPSAAATEEQQQPSPARGRSRSTRRSTAADKSNNDDTVVPNADDTIQSIEPATPSRRDATGLDLADDVFGDLDESFADGSVPVVPGSAETTASWSNFRPRSRQSSIIGRNDPPIRPSSRASNTPAIGSSFTIGAFRRRAREPSILATSRRPTSRAATSDIESETEFAPDAESTPVNTRGRRATRASLAASTVEASTSRATRKRKSEVPHINNEQPEKKVADEDSESESELSEVSSPKPLRQPFARPVTPMNDDEIMAPPASSGSEDEGDSNWPDIHSLAQRKGRPGVSTPRRGADDVLSDVSSPPSLTHSPNLRAASKNAPVIKSPPKLTTADLASLLPKRRYKKPATRDDLDDSSDEEEEEEGSRRNSSRRRRSGGLKKSTPNKGKQAQRRSKRATRRISDKENQENQSDAEDEHEESAFIPLPEDTFDSALERVRDLQEVDELRNATKKFAEVDKWEMEYEEVAESFSPKGGR